MTTLVATDLDRTLIYSANAARVPVDDLVCVEQYEGADQSYMSKRAYEALAALSASATVLPVTTRTVAQVDRVKLPIRGDYLVAANGGVIVHNGQRDQEWAERIDAMMSKAAPLEQVLERLRVAVAQLPGARVRDAEGLFCYAVSAQAHLASAGLSELADWAAGQGWRASMQGRKFYLVPVDVTKGAAVAEVAARLGARVILAAGDSLLDADMLRVADRGVVPSHGELFEQGWGAGHVHRVSGAGVLAGEQILDWLSRQACLPDDGQGVMVAPALRCEEAGETPARSRHCNHPSRVVSQIFRRERLASRSAG